MVDQLVAAERKPREDRLNRREAEIEARLSAFGSIRGGLSALETALGKLAGIQQGRTATSSDSTRLGVSAGANAVPGNYSIQINQLATAQTLASAGFDDADGPVGTGTLTLRVGDGPALDVVIDDGNNSLRGIRDAINQADAGVQASIVNDGSGSRLVLSSNRTGAANTISVTVSGSDGLARLASANLTQTMAPQDAEAVINGLTVTSPSNSLGPDPGGPDPRPEGHDRGGCTDHRHRGPGQGRGAFRAERVREGLQRRGRDRPRSDPVQPRDPGRLGAGGGQHPAVHPRPPGPGAAAGGRRRGRGFTSLVNLGVNSDRNGMLSLDSAALDRAMDQDFQGVISLVNEVSGGLRDTVQGFTQAGGLLDARTDGLRTRMRDIDRQREMLDARMEQFEARTVRQFGAMDSLVGQLQNTSQFLDQQLGALNAMLNQGRKR
jgi:flagellar hook-associated protein 2